MRKLITIMLLSLTIGSMYAQRGKRIKGNGNFVTMERQTNDYDEIRIGGFFEVEFIDGTEGEITLKGEDNILEFIITEVRGGTLTIKSKDDMQLRPSSGATVFITVPVEQINALRLSGSGKVVGKKILESTDFKIHTSGSKNADLTINAKNSKVISSGSSNITLGGTTERLDITSSGSSNLRAFELIANTVEINSSGSSNIRISVHNKIDVKSSGSSNIKYRGNPERVYSKSSGSSTTTKEN